jgi:DNA-dependent RNA polymerase auxiliary subunit epsilon
LARYGKWLSYQEVRTLLKEEEIELSFVSKKYGKKIEYTKTVILDKEYGVSVLWDT